MNTATRQGAADPDVNAGEVVVEENPRQVAIDAISANMMGYDPMKIKFIICF